MHTQTKNPRTHQNLTLSLESLQLSAVEIRAAEGMIYGEDFTQRTETAKVEMKIMID